jgi:MFS family permease
MCAIVLAALLLPSGRAADSIGRRECFLAGLVVFDVASLGCAVVPDLPALIACRALQGAGAAMLMPTSLGLALSVFPSRQRGTAFGIWAGIGAVAADSGPVLGGLLVESSWRWIFLINLPVILATLAAGVATILPRRGNVCGGERSGRRIDGMGSLLVLGAVGLVCTALTEAPGPGKLRVDLPFYGASSLTVLVEEIHSATAGGYGGQPFMIGLWPVLRVSCCSQDW